MNIRNILKAYSLLRSLTDDESALLATLRSLNDTERELLVESLSPSVKSTKKAGKKAGKGASKSARASSLQQQIQATTNKPHLGDGPICQVCSHTEDYEDHQQPSPHYHEFQPPQQKAASGD